jgi:hypothetical protein
MLFDLVSYPGWLAAALAIGVVVGWRTYSDAPKRRWLDGWPKWGGLVFVIGLVVAVLKLLPGRYGLWLEIALLVTAFYIVGCFLGGWLKNLLGAHEAVGAGAPGGPDVEIGRGTVKAAVERHTAATAKAAVARLAAKVEADRRAAAAAKAEADRLAAGAAARAEAARRADKTEADRPARRLLRRPRQNNRPLRRRRIVWRLKLPQKPRLNEGPPRRRRVVWLQKLPRRPMLCEKLSPRPRRVVGLQRLPRRLKLSDRPVAGPDRLRRRTALPAWPARNRP